MYSSCVRVAIGLFVIFRCGVIVFKSSQDFQKFVHFNSEAAKNITKV